MAFPPSEMALWQMGYGFFHWNSFQTESFGHRPLLYFGDNDTPVQCQWHHCAMCSRVRFPYKNSVLNICKDVGKKAHWQCCATNFDDYLCNFETIFEKVLTCLSGTQGNFLEEKKQRSKIVCQGPFEYSDHYVKTSKVQIFIISFSDMIET
jgi:hypothetical protein